MFSCDMVISSMRKVMTSGYDALTKCCFRLLCTDIWSASRVCLSRKLKYGY